MVRTKFSQRKTSGPEAKNEPPAKSVKLSADNESEAASTTVTVDTAAIVLDLDKVQATTKLLPKIPKIKKEPAEISEEVAIKTQSQVRLII